MMARPPNVDSSLHGQDGPDNNGRADIDFAIFRT